MVGSKKKGIWDDLVQPPMQIIDKRVEFPELGTFVEHKTTLHKSINRFVRSALDNFNH